MAMIEVAIGGTAIAVADTATIISRAIAVADTATTIGRATAALRVLVVGAIYGHLHLSVQLVHLHLPAAMPMATRLPMAAMQWCRLPCDRGGDHGTRVHALPLESHRSRDRHRWRSLHQEGLSRTLHEGGGYVLQVRCDDTQNYLPMEQLPAMTCQSRSTVVMTATQKHFCERRSKP